MSYADILSDKKFHILLLSKEHYIAQMTIFSNIFKQNLAGNEVLSGLKIVSKNPSY